MTTKALSKRAGHASPISDPVTPRTMDIRMGAVGRIVSSLVLVVTLAAPAAAFVPEDTPPRRAEAAGRAMLERPAARGTLPGIVVMRGGRILWGANIDSPMLPASIMKLATTTAAMRRLGPAHRLVTRVLAPAETPIVDTLWLVGGGDPTLATESYRRRRFLPKPSDDIQRPAFAGGSPTIENLAAGVRAAGVRTVGTIVADESMFDAERTQPGWLRSYLDDDPDVSYLSALTVNEGRFGRERKGLFRDPSRAAADALVAALEDAGVSVGGVGVGRAPGSAVEIARVVSPPLAEIVDFINRYSVNYPSELLLKYLGAREGKAGTTAAGARIVRETLEELGVDMRAVTQADASGLSLNNRMTPRAIAGILDLIVSARWDGADALRASIPVAGEPGTLLRRMTRAPTGGNLRGKTGQIRMVRGMAGWVTAADGVPLVYVAVFNRAPSPFSLTAPLDLFGSLLALFPR